MSGSPEIVSSNTATSLILWSPRPSKSDMNQITWKLTMDSRKRRFLVEIIKVRFPCYFWDLSMSMIVGFPTWCNDLSNWLTDQIPVQPNFAWNMQLNDTRCAEQSA